MATRGNKNAIGLLTEDHDRVRRPLSELEDTTEDETEERRDLLHELEREVKVHSQIEQEIFYPAFKDAAEATEETKLYHEAREEHRLVDMLLPEVKQADPGSEIFAAKAKVLKDIIEHHVDEEEQEMFRTAREIMSDDQLRELGEQILTRRDELMAPWGPNGGSRRGERHRPARGRSESVSEDEEEESEETEGAAVPVRSHRRPGSHRR
jgi:hemerythrin-like domain-containing protein